MRLHGPEPAVPESTSIHWARLTQDTLCNAVHRPNDCGGTSVVGSRSSLNAEVLITAHGAGSDYRVFICGLVAFASDAYTCERLNPVYIIAGYHCAAESFTIASSQYCKNVSTYHGSGLAYTAKV